MCDRGYVAIAMGVDVGGRRKGFDVALVEGASLVGLHSRRSCAEVVEIALEAEPAVIGIDSPASCASAGEKSRPGERDLAKEVCPIFFTPDEAQVRSGNPFYGWVVEGLALYEALRAALPGTPCTEVFPSAAWTAWAGPRDGRPKTLWSRQALERTGIDGLPARCSQDSRDAAGAALVAGLYGKGRTLDFGGIAVPRAGQ